MYKKNKITSKIEYKTPAIDIEELEKQDVLTDSDDNKKVNFEEIQKGNDLFSSMAEDLGI